MPRQAKLFEACKGSPSKAIRKGVANVPPAWIERAHDSRKSLEPSIVKAIQILKKLRLKRPRAKMTIKNAENGLREALKRWELAYQKENFYNGVRALMELQRNGKSDR